MCLPVRNTEGIVNRVLILLATALLLPACGSDESTSSGSVQTDSVGQPPAPVRAEPQPQPVEVTPLLRQDVRETLDLVGTAKPWDEFEVSSEIQGKISAIHADQGQWVKKGALLLELDREKRLLELRSREANLARVKVELEFDRKRLERGLSLLEKGATSDSEVDALREAVRIGETSVRVSEIAIDSINQEIEDTKIYSPASGKISRRHVSRGETASPARTLFTIVQLSPIKVVSEIAEPYLHQIQPGDVAQITFEAVSRDPVKGRIHFVDPVANPDSGAFPTEIRLGNPGVRIQPGMIARLQLEASLFIDVLVAPADALVDLDGRYAVFVVEGDVALRRDIAVERRFGQNAIISGNLKEGDLLVTKGSANIVNGAPVEVAP